MSLLLSLPQEVLDNIAFHYSCPTLHGCPIPLSPLLLTCRTLYHRLKLPECSRPADDRDNDRIDGNPALYARIYRYKFSVTAITRREFTPTALECVDLFVRYIAVLLSVKSTLRTMDSGLSIGHFLDIQEMLSAMLFMLLEDDGCNSALLNEVGAYECVLGLLMGRGNHPGFLNETSWPDDNITNTCSLWILWLLTTREHILAESEEFMNLFIDRLSPFMFAPFRYPACYAPPNHFHLPLNSSRSTVSSYHRPSSLHALSIPTNHGPYPVYYSSRMFTNEVQAGRRIRFSYSPVSAIAKLLVTARRQIRSPITIPRELPVNREEAIRIGFNGPTQEDIHEWNSGGIIIPGDIPRNSRDYDSDWWRMRMCGDAWDSASCDRRGRVYESSSLAGLWTGRRLIPDELRYREFYGSEPSATNAPTEASLPVFASPLYMRLQEHVSFLSSGDANVLPCGGPRPTNTPLEPPKNMTEGAERSFYEAEFDQGIQEAWFPSSTSIKPSWDGTGVKLAHPHSDASYHYTTLGRERPGEPGRWHDPDTCSGCLQRERILEKARKDDGHRMVPLYNDGDEDVDMSVDEESDEEDDDDFDEDLYSPEEDAGNAQALPECDGVKDTIVTGETDLRHSLAWSEHYTYRGRVRPWDGAVSITRYPQDITKGRIVMYGYIIGLRNFVGVWRTTSSDLHAPAYEGPVMMGRRD